MNPKAHLENVDNKARIMNRKLAAIRMKANLEISTSFFKIFIDPQYYQINSCFDMYSRREKGVITKHYKKTFKFFATLPRNTPDWILEKALGNY